MKNINLKIMLLSTALGACLFDNYNCKNSNQSSIKALKLLTDLINFISDNTKNEKKILNQKSNFKNITYNKKIYSYKHWALHFPNSRDKNFIANLSINSNVFSFILNPTDSRGYRSIVKLVNRDMNSTINRKYTFDEDLSLNIGLTILSQIYKELKLIPQIQIAGNNSQKLIGNGLCLIGNKEEPSILHDHIIGRGDPNFNYINGIPLKCPKPETLFDMRGNGTIEGNFTKEKWKLRDMEIASNIFRNLLKEFLKNYTIPNVKLYN